MNTFAPRKRFAVVALGLSLGLIFGFSTSAGAAPKKRSAAKAAGRATATKLPPPANAEAIAALRGEFKWGMNLDEVAAILEKRIVASYADRIKDTANDPTRNDRLRKQMRAEIEDVKKGYVEFTGKTTGYDVSIIDQEFAHGTGESMLPAKEENATRYFFFADGRLYKMFVAFDKQLVADKSFEEFGELMQKQYGKAREVEVEITRKGESRKLLDYFEWRTDSGEGLRLVDRSGFYGVYCLVLYEQAVQARLAQGHAEARRRGGGREALVEAVLNTSRADHDVNANIIDQLTGETIYKPGQGPAQSIVVPSTTGLAPSAAEVNAAGRAAESSTAAPARKPGAPARKPETSGLEL